MMFKTPLPAPAGPFQVGYVDLMTPGDASTSSLLRIHYPSPAYTKVTKPPVWAGENGQEGMLTFMKTMIWNWPSWANTSEFHLLDLCKKIFTPAQFFSAFNIGWTLVAKRLTIPIVRSAALEPHAGPGWPVVVFSHGIGCSRFSMSQLCYQLSSMGVVVVSVEHREGSGFGTHFKDGEKVEEIPHLRVPVDEHEYEVRNRQVNHRCDEVLRAIDILDKINAGQTLSNVIADHDDMDLSMLQYSMDLTSHLYLMGHSFGGATVLLASSLDTRVKAVLALDPWMFPLAKQEFTIEKNTQVVNTVQFVNKNNLRVIEEALNKNIDIKYEVYRNGVHLSVTDIPCVFTQTSLRKGLGFMDKVSPETVMVETNKIVWDWLRNLVN